MSFIDPATGEYSSDLFWEQKVQWAEAGDRSDAGTHCIRAGGVHYTAKPGIVRAVGMLGHGGRRFRWLSTDGNFYESNNVWFQGEIPEHFRDRLPDNAYFLPGWWCPPCSEYHVGDHCPQMAARFAKAMV